MNDNTDDVTVDDVVAAWTAERVRLAEFLAELAREHAAASEDEPRA